MSDELACALDLIYEDETTAEAASLAGQPVRIRVQSNPGELSPFAGEIQADGLIIRVRRSEVLAQPARGAVLQRQALGLAYRVVQARPDARGLEWRLDVTPEDLP